MYVLERGIKKDPERRWALPDRIFFGHGACHILAGAFLGDPPLAGFHAERIVPAAGHFGNHVYVTDGVVAFDYHGYSARSRLLQHHQRAWSRHEAGWSGVIETVDFDLLDTPSLNQRKMLGPDQYRHDPVDRALHFIRRRDHVGASMKARDLALRAM